MQNPKILITITDKMKDELKKIAEEQACSVATIVRMAIIKYLIEVEKRLI